MGLNRKEEGNIIKVKHKYIVQKNETDSFYYFTNVIKLT